MDSIPALGGTEVVDLWSDEVGDTFRVFVGHCGADPTTTLLVTDANGLFGLAVDTVRAMQLPALLPPMLVVGLGYPGADTLLDTIDVRARDLTPTNARPFERSGGSAVFTRFLVNELHPWLAGRFPACAADVTYFGHSLGGLFGAGLLLARPETFARYILSSPSLWWDDDRIVRTESEWAASHDDLAADVFFGIGADENDAGRRLEAANLPVGHPAKPPSRYLDMVDDLRRFVTALEERAYPSLDLEFSVFADEFHVTVPGVVLSHALRHFDLGEHMRGRGRPR